MKRFLSCAFLIACLSIPAFAKNSATVSFVEATTVGSTKLPAGQYRVSWENGATFAKVTFEQQDTSHPATTTVTAKIGEASGGPTGFVAEKVGGVSKLNSLHVGKINLVLSGSSAQGQ